MYEAQKVKRKSARNQEKQEWRNRHVLMERSGVVPAHSRFPQAYAFNL